MCLGHSNRTICSMLSQFCSTKFPIFSLSCWESNSYYPRERKVENWKMRISQPEVGRRICVPWAFKLEHLRSVKPTFSPNFPTFSLLCWEFNSYYPRATLLAIQVPVTSRSLRALPYFASRHDETVIRDNDHR